MDPSPASPSVSIFSCWRLMWSWRSCSKAIAVTTSCVSATTKLGHTSLCAFFRRCTCVHLSWAPRALETPENPPLSNLIKVRLAILTGFNCLEGAVGLHVVNGSAKRIWDFAFLWGSAWPQSILSCISHFLWPRLSCQSLHTLKSTSLEHAKLQQLFLHSSSES